MTDWPSLKSMLTICSVDHAANRRRVLRRHVANPSQHDREILFLDRGCDDGNRRRRRGGDIRAVREMFPSEVGSGGDCEHYEAGD